MKKQLRVLGIAPYEGMKTLMSSLAADYPQIGLTLFVGDLEQGVEIARSSFHGNYDVVISRGGTAKLLRQLSLPVIEIEVSMYDILCAVKLADGVSGRTAMVSFSNITGNARLLCDLLGYDVDIFTIESADMVEPTLRQLQNDNYQAILCDMIANTTAKRLGMNSFLITSGLDSIRRAFEQALDFARNQKRLRDENQFFRQVIRGQIGQTVVFGDDGGLFFSTLEEPAADVLELLHREIPLIQGKTQRRITRNLNGMLYSIRAQRISAGNLSCTAFFFAARKSPISSGQMGIRFLTNTEAENAFYNSIFSFAGTVGDQQGEITRVNQSAAPVMVAGEDGTGKEPLVSVIYLRSTFKNNPLVSVNCSLLNEKSWVFLLEHHNSPLADEGNTLYFSSVDVLTAERRSQLLAALSEMEVCRRNRVIFSCVCQPGEYITPAGAEIMDKLCCLSLYLPPLRSQSDRIPPMVNLTLSHLNVELAHQIVGAEPEAIGMLKSFSWPYNYTQFRRVIGELAVTAEGQIITAESVRNLLKKERHVGAFSACAENAATPLDLNRTLDEISRDVALRVLEETGGNQTAAAKRLGISRTTLWRLTRNV